MSRNRINVMAGLFVAVVFVLAGCRRAEPEAVPAQGSVEVRGVPSCGVWAEGVKKHECKVWLIGYLDGRVMGSGKDFLKGTDNPSIELWMDNYCKANPLKDIGDGANELAAELIRQKNL